MALQLSLPQRCECDVREARHHGRMFEELIAEHREENLAIRHPDGSELTDEIAAFFACSRCQPKHSIVLSSRPPVIEPREKAAWNPQWGCKPFDYGATDKREND